MTRNCKITNSLHATHFLSKISSFNWSSKSLTVTKPRKFQCLTHTASILSYWKQSISSHNNSLKFILTVPFYLLLELTSDLLPRFLTLQMHNLPLPQATRLTPCPLHPPTFINLAVSVKNLKYDSLLSPCNLYNKPFFRPVENICTFLVILSLRRKSVLKFRVRTPKDSVKRNLFFYSSPELPTLRR